jgi:hypothetical protein
MPGRQALQAWQRGKALVRHGHASAARAIAAAMQHAANCQSAGEVLLPAGWLTQGASYAAHDRPYGHRRPSGALYPSCLWPRRWLSGHQSRRQRGRRRCRPWHSGHRRAHRHCHRRRHRGRFDTACCICISSAAGWESVCCFLVPSQHVPCGRQVGGRQAAAAKAQCPLTHISCSVLKPAGQPDSQRLLASNSSEGLAGVLTMSTISATQVLEYCTVQGSRAANVPAGGATGVSTG